MKKTNAQIMEENRGLHAAFLITAKTAQQYADEAQAAYRKMIERGLLHTATHQMQIREAVFRGNKDGKDFDTNEASASTDYNRG